LNKHHFSDVAQAKAKFELKGMDVHALVLFDSRGALFTNLIKTAVKYKK
jgi:hypothetical protein